MSHHSQSPDPEFQKFLKEFLGLGATGNFPQGKIAPSDEGEIKIAIGHQGNKVVIDFGKPVAWMGFSREQAISIAKALIEHAGRCAPSHEPA